MKTSLHLSWKGTGCPVFGQAAARKLRYEPVYTFNRDASIQNRGIPAIGV